MRVLHVQKAKGIGGSERHLLALLPAMAAHGVESRLCVLEAGDGHRFVSAAQRAGIDTIRLRAGPDVNPALIAALRAEIRQFRPDVVHTHLVHADVAGQIAARVARVPAISSMHDTLAAYRHEPYRSAGRIVGRLAARRIAISEHVAGYVRALGLSPSARVRVVHYGIDSRAWAPDPAAATRARATLALPSDVLVVGIASRLVPGKGHDVLIEAVAGAVADGVPLRLVVAGAGPRRAELEAQAARRCPPGTIRFLGFVDDVRPVLAACDVVTVPTQPELGEGFGLAALEAMALGRPVVASDLASLPEVVDERSGLLVQPGSVDLLQKALVQLATDPPLRARLGDGAVARARDVFGLDAMAARTLAVYKEVA